MRPLERRLRWKLRKARWRLRRGLRGLERLALQPVRAGTVTAVVPLLALAFASAFAATYRASGETERPEATTRHLEETRGEASLRSYHDLRLTDAAPYARKYGVERELAAMIHDIAREEGLDPELAFRLVRVESSFRRTAVGPAGAVGYTQVRPGTARWLDSTITREKLFEAETNLRLGFRYLRMMLDRYDNDTRLALLAYNRGPGTVAVLMSIGEDPGNGYATRVLGTEEAPAATLDAAPEDATEEAPATGQAPPTGAVEGAR